MTRHEMRCEYAARLLAALVGRIPMQDHQTQDALVGTSVRLADKLLAELGQSVEAQDTMELFVHLDEENTHHMGVRDDQGRICHFATQVEPNMVPTRDGGSEFEGTFSVTITAFARRTED